jgi:hypothetical protein
VVQELAKRDRASERERSRQVALDRIVDPELSLLGKLKDDCRDERLRHAADTEALRTVPRWPVSGDG